MEAEKYLWCSSDKGNAILILSPILSVSQVAYYPTGCSANDAFKESKQLWRAEIDGSKTRHQCAVGKIIHFKALVLSSSGFHFT